MRVLNESTGGDRGKTRERGGVGKGFGIQSKGSDRARHSSAIVPSRWYLPFSVLDNFFFCTSTVQHYPASLAPIDSNSLFHMIIMIRLTKVVGGRHVLTAFSMPPWSLSRDTSHLAPTETLFRHKST